MCPLTWVFNVMESSLTLSSTGALFGTMVVLALMPSVSVLTVSARSAAYGFTHGVYTAMGILAGDIIFIVIAIYGLSVLSEVMGDHFALVKYLGGSYLMWLGIVLWRSRTNPEGVDENIQSSLSSSFLAGLFITLADQKAILFYLGFFPAFLDLSTLSIVDTGIIIAIVTVAIGTKLVYAIMANRARLLLRSPRFVKGLNVVAGSIMIGVGMFVVVKA